MAPVPEFKPLDILGTSGLRQHGGWVIEEFLRQLRGPRGLELIKEMTWNNPQAGAIRMLIHSLVRQVEWTVQMASKPSNPTMAQWACELVETSRDDMSHTWSDFMGEALSHVDYGFSYHEIVYKMRRGPKGERRSKFNDGAFGWHAVELRSQDSLDHWEFKTEDGSLCGFWQRDMYANRYCYIPVEKAIHFRTEKYKNNPEGRSIFRNAVIPYLRLKHLEDIEAIGVERDLAGMPVMQVPLEMLDPNAPGPLKAIRRELERILGQVKRDEREYVLMPSEQDAEGKPTGYKFQLLASGGTRQTDIVRIKESYKTDILMSVLAQFLQLGTQSATGSWALADSATNLFSLALGAVLDNMQDTINRQLVDPLCELNCIAEEDRPFFKRGDIETPDLAQLGGFLQTMFTTGTLEASDKLKESLHHAASLPYEPQLATPSAGVKTAQQLVDEIMGAGKMNITDPATPGAPAPTGGVKTADQLIAEANGTAAPPAGKVKTADELIADANKPPVKTADELIAEHTSPNEEEGE